MQGALAGVSFAVGYGLGVLLMAVWEYLELPLAPERLRRRGTWAAAAVAAAVVVSFSWRAVGWQNSIREPMGMPPAASAEPLEVILIAAVVFAVLYLIARLFRLVYLAAKRPVLRWVPIRVARVIAVAVAIALFFTVGNGLLLRGFLRMADQSASAFDALIEPQYPAPADRSPPAARTR